MIFIFPKHISESLQSLGNKPMTKVDSLKISKKWKSFVFDGERSHPHPLLPVAQCNAFGFDTRHTRHTKVL
jgi:hypothetical protein